MIFDRDWFEVPHRQRRQGPRQLGFTLVELIMVMVVIGILAVFVAPRFSALSGFSEVGYRDKVKAALEFARKSAVAQRRSVRVATAGNGLTLDIETCHPEGTATSVPACSGPIALGNFPRQLLLPSGSTNQITAPNAVMLTGPTALVFDPLGRASGTTHCDAPRNVANFCFTVTGPSIIEVEAETGYVH